MTLEGMDVDVAAQVAAMLNSQGQDLQQIIANLAEKLHNVQWRGPDQARFANAWGEWSNGRAAAVRQLFDLAAHTLQSEITQQRNASAT